LKLKTYTAATMALALALVKQDLGSQAMIVHTRSFKRGGFLGIGSNSVVEITATDQGSGSPRRSRSRPLRTTALPPRQQLPKPEPTAGDLIRRTYAAAQAQFSSKQIVIPGGIQSDTATGLPLSASGPPMAPSDQSSGHHQLAQEMKAVKRIVAQMMRQPHHRSVIGSKESSGVLGARDIPEKLFDRYLGLLEQEVAQELAEGVVHQVLDQLNSTQLEDEATVHQAVHQTIAKLIPTDESTEPLRQADDGRPRTVALIGPTGVGKTTTIAKLAATFKLKQKKNVGLITLDTYRIAAVDQLRTYADIIGIPLHVALSPQELVSATRKCAGCDVILIDTAGRSQRDDKRLDQLHGFFQAANPHEVHLVLSSNSAQPVIMEAVKRFSTIGADRIIFTKLDEAVNFGVLLNVAKQVNKRLSYVTMGQDVPDHIEPGRSARIADLVMGGGGQSC